MNDVDPAPAAIAAPTTEALGADEGLSWRRHPSDVARLLVSAVGFLLSIAAAAAYPTVLTNLSADVVQLVGRLPASVRDLLVGSLQIAIVVLPVILVIWAARWRRPRELAVVALGGLLATACMSLLIGWLDRVAPPSLLGVDPGDSWVANSDFPSISFAAGLAAVVTIVAPALGHGWRRVAWASVGLTVVVRTLTATQVPVNVAVATLLGITVGSAVLVAVGAPVRPPGVEHLRAALAALRLDLRDIETLAGVGRTREWRGRARDGRLIRLVFVGADERDADLLYRLVRRLRVKGLADESPGVSPRRLARNEALVTMLAGSRGVAVPEVLGVHECEDTSAILAIALPEGPRLDAVPADELDDRLLRALWTEVAVLHGAGLAHRELRAEHVSVTDGAPVLTDFRWGRTSPTPEQQLSDVAELLVSTALLVGPERAVAAAADALDHARLVDVMRYVQPLAVSDPTRRAARAVDDLFDDLRSELERVTGADGPELEPLARITVAGVLAGVGFFVLVGFALGLAANFDDIVDAMRGADWEYLPWILLAMLVTYVGGALSLTGCVLRPIGLGESTVVMFGQSFLNRFTPANAGGMAMRIRYLQKGGTDVAVATAAIGLTSAASGVMQVVLVVVFFTWSGSTQGGGDTTPIDGWTVALVALGIVAVVAIVWAVPSLRRTVAEWISRSWAAVRSEYAGLARRPSKLVSLFGGAGLSKLAYIVAFAWSVKAFGIDLGFAEVGALYLMSTTVAAAVPSPGGVGAIEAALVFVLTGAGADEASAWSATLLFRLVTYWLPTVPGWLALKYCERRDLV